MCDCMICMHTGERASMLETQNEFFMRSSLDIVGLSIVISWSTAGLMVLNP